MGLPLRYQSDPLPRASELATRPGGYPRIGAVWGAAGLWGIPGDSRSRPLINALADNTAAHGGASWRHWVADPVDGSIIGSDSDTPPYRWDVGELTYQSMLTVEPPSRRQLVGVAQPGEVGVRGTIWRFGAWESSTYDSPVELYFAWDPAAALAPGVRVTTHRSSDGDPLNPGTFGLTGDIRDFGIDRDGGRVWYRTSTMLDGTVSMFKLGTNEHIADLYAPNVTRGIIPIGDYVWLVDDAGWLLRYDYFGKLWGVVRNQRPAMSKGRSYGWDFTMQRLLVFEADAGGAQILAFWPTELPTRCTGMIPRRTPRNGRRCSTVANVFGDSGQGISSRVATCNDDGSTVISDADGDLVKFFTPIGSGSYVLNITVDNNP